MVVFIVVTSTHVGNVYLDHGDAIDDYNRQVDELCASGATIVAEQSVCGDILHETKYQFSFLPHEDWIKLIRREVKGRLLHVVD
jgi:hypothetical protein